MKTLSDSILFYYSKEIKAWKSVCPTINLKEFIKDIKLELKATIAEPDANAEIIDWVINKNAGEKLI